MADQVVLDIVSAEIKKALLDEYQYSDEFGLNENEMAVAIIEWAMEGADYDSDLFQNIVNQLQSINCAGCHAPSGLIYNVDLAEKLSRWWDEIDNCLDQYRDTTGESFAPETCGQLVWFAVEWLAHEMGSFLESHTSADNWSEVADDPDFEELHNRFEDSVLPYVQECFEGDGVVDYPARCEEFSNWIDALEKDGEISQYTAREIPQPDCNDRD